MSSFSKLLLVAVTALGGVATSAHAGTEPSGFQAKSVIASHEAAPTLTAVAHHPRHRHHRKHRAHPVRQPR